jgi:hypothetical protein
VAPGKRRENLGIGPGLKRRAREGDKGEMNQRTLHIPGTLQHTGDDQTDVALQTQAREHVDRHPGLRFLADVLGALHASTVPLRNTKSFYGAFMPRQMMEAFAQRPDLRVKSVKAITGGAPGLLRRLPADALASQIELLVIEDLPEVERSVRAEGDRMLTVYDLYLKYLDPLDIATYLPARTIWTYESHDDWWKWEPSAGTRALMGAELRSIRRHGILSDAEILDLLGEVTLEQYLSLAVRTALRKAARRAAAAGRPFTDADLFAGTGIGGRDLIDEMVDTVPMPHLRAVVSQVGRMLGLSELDDTTEEPTKVTVPREAAPTPTPIGVRVGPKPTPPAAPMASTPSGKHRAGATPPPKPIPTPPGAKAGRPAPVPADAAGPPEPDDDLAFLEELSGRVV